uniref:Uncharacterized protein n=1 Tax=Setaria viridis TaxID=4556 RepID=A0A4U6TA17_SETVI|nr:hypothetical protein SEVIR_9G583750v2 [Setaria viridis]
MPCTEQELHVKHEGNDGGKLKDNSGVRLHNLSSLGQACFARRKTATSKHMRTQSTVNCIARAAWYERCTWRHTFVHWAWRCPQCPNAACGQGLKAVVTTVRGMMVVI